MTPEDLSAVQRSWPECLRTREPLLDALARRFDSVAPTPLHAEQRARWLFSAIEDLVGLLSAPSRLAARARDVGATWPDPLTAPSFGVEGRAWMQAADECLVIWSRELEASWRQAWMLLSDVLAAEALSPFTDEPG
jgi:hypothetical protein